MLIRWFGFNYGYSKGTEIVGDMAGGKLQKLTQGASILGLFVMGSLVSKWTSINVPFVLSKYTDTTGKEVVTSIQSVLDQLLPGLLALLLTFLCMNLLRRKSKCDVRNIWVICCRNSRLLARNISLIKNKNTLPREFDFLFESVFFIV